MDWIGAAYHENLQGQLPDEECEMIENYIQDLESCMSSCSTRVLLHADLGLDNVILDHKEKRISVIDFTDWHFGDPVCDFSSLYYDSPTLAERSSASTDTKKIAPACLRGQKSIAEGYRFS